MMLLLLLVSLINSEPYPSELLPLASCPMQDDSVLPWDTAYVDEATPIDNLAETMTASDRSFRGPGPFTVHFEAEIPDNVTFYAWEIANDGAFQDIAVTYRELDVDYEFSDTGTYYARFTTYDDKTEVETFSETYSFQVTESLLDIPNVITPNSPSGANQVFKVKYKSLKSFELWIVNRWGNELFHTTDPSKGWDGTQGGKPVPTGTYYYLVKAVGTDGVRYNKKGDLNVLRLKQGFSNNNDM